MCSYAHNCTRWQDNSNIFSKEAPAPSSQLTISYMAILLVILSFIGISILLLVLKPSCAQYPLVYAHCYKSRVLCYASWCWLVCIHFPIIHKAQASVDYWINLLAANTLFLFINDLTVITSTPELNIDS